MKPAVNDVIPQRYPFEMIDKFIDVQPGVSASAIKLISINEWFFANQTSSRLAVPRPIMIEQWLKPGLRRFCRFLKIKGRMSFSVESRMPLFKMTFDPVTNWNLKLS